MSSEVVLLSDTWSVKITKKLMSTPATEIQVILILDAKLMLVHDFG
jgi:hypothetical protein